MSKKRSGREREIDAGPREGQHYVTAIGANQWMLWRYHFLNVTFAELQQAIPRDRRGTYRRAVKLNNPWTIHYPDPQNNYRITLPSIVIEEGNLSNVESYALGYADQSARTLILLPLREGILRNMFSASGLPSAMVRFSVVKPKSLLPHPRKEREPQAMFEGTNDWRDPFWQKSKVEESEKVGQKQLRLSPQPISNLFVSELFLWREPVLAYPVKDKLRKDESQFRALRCLKIPEPFLTTEMERYENQRPGFAMYYDRLGNVILIRQHIWYDTGFGLYKTP